MDTKIVKMNIDTEPTVYRTDSTGPFAELERGIYSSLETYSNVHRGSGHFSLVTTHLFEQARNIVLEYMGLNENRYKVIFCTPRNAEIWKTQLRLNSYQIISGKELGLSVGVCALAVKKSKLPKGTPFQTGGGTARLMSKDWVVWAKAPDRFEAGTPAIINIIAFARALRMIQKSGKNIFLNQIPEKLAVQEVLYHDELENYSGQELLAELRKTLIGNGVQVPTMDGVRTFVNLDNSASTRTFMPIWKTFCRLWNLAEPEKQKIIQEVKSICAQFLNAPPAGFEVIFTSNTTEAINLAAESLSHDSAEDTELVVLNSLAEHSSNDLPWRMIPGCSLIRLSVDDEGFISLKELETTLKSYNQENLFGKKRIKMVAVSGASNVLGVCNNIAEICRIAHQYGARVLVDAAQLVAHHQINMESIGVDYLAFSGHKVYAPFGCGVLVVRKDLLHFMAPEMNLIRKSGEENVGGIAALGKALILLNRIGMDLIRAEEQVLTSRALRGLVQISDLEIYGVKNPESPGFQHKIGVIVLALKSKMATQVGKELAFLGGIGVRTGCHCAHITVKHILHVGPKLEKFQKLIVTLFPRLSLPGVVRISLGLENSDEDVDTFIQVLKRVANKSDASNFNPALSKAEVKKQIDVFIQEVALKVYH